MDPLRKCQLIVDLLLSSVKKLSLDLKSDLTEQVTDSEGGFYSKNPLQNSGCALALEDVSVLFTNDVPRECGKVFPSSHPGNGCFSEGVCIQILPLHLQCD